MVSSQSLFSVAVSEAVLSPVIRIPRNRQNSDSAVLVVVRTAHRTPSGVAPVFFVGAEEEVAYPLENPDQTCLKLLDLTS